MNGKASSIVVGVTCADREVMRGVARQHVGDLHGAVACFKHAIALDPTCFNAYNNLGGVFASLRDWDTALLFVQAAAEMSPSSAEVQANLADLYLRLGKTDMAVESCRQAVALKPDDPSFLNALGNALRVQGRYTEAEACFQSAIAIQQPHAESYVNLGFLYYMQRRHALLVEQCYRRAIACKPGLAQAHVNLSHSLLRRGEFVEGWLEHEWRWQQKDFPSPKRNFTAPQWRGECVRGDCILLHAEQGFGDTIQFLRYVPMVATTGAKVVLEVHPELRTLAAWFAGDSVQVISRGDTLPEFAWHCPLMSLPLAFQTELRTIPAEVPYLRTEYEVPQWLCHKRTSGLHVGLLWAGGAINVIDHERSLALQQLSALWQVEHVSFYSLQRGPAGQQIEASGLSFAGIQPQTGDFAATAASISHLDLVIAVDTSVAHLAGALGKPTWILLPIRTDWRWFTYQDHSPWYPSVKLFRQNTEGDWAAVIARVAAELTSLAECP